MLTKLTFFILRLMGIKRIFSQSPIDYNNFRKSDVKAPPKRFRRLFVIENNTIEETKVIRVSSKNSLEINDGLILFIPGGAFIAGPAKHHWDAVEKIVSTTGKTVWMVDYPKAPEVDIHKISNNIDAVYNAALKESTPTNLILIGDSVGANLIMTLVQRCIKKTLKVASKLILITPVFDASMTNPDILDIDKKDPMLSLVGVLSAKEMCANGLDLKDPKISPLYGDFKDFPKTMLLIGGKDIMYPDGDLGAEKLKQSKVKLELIDAPEMPHIFPLLPVMPEAKRALKQIIDFIE